MRYSYIYIILALPVVTAAFDATNAATASFNTNQTPANLYFLLAEWTHLAEVLYALTINMALPLIIHWHLCHPIRDAKATAAASAQRFALKAHYQLGTDSLGHQYENKMAKDSFNDERRALRECENSPDQSTPRYFGHADFPLLYSAGYARILAMFLARGTSVVEIPTLLDIDRAIIREKLTDTLE
ncbi:hypothetical protein BO71DRAFT_406838 [Aspergillus ellipticus CBS 707.79]|uniref:Uncharacterized protein n=1 Tax=Aspergillus ellipticus CBS 707.79 TaxID=1448320 RepID=A0A319DJB9_9EURO|nr:hypothetical protein BO71DRAFT_406838 [Aspergillus ellipticus CBS 707.79]